MLARLHPAELDRPQRPARGGINSCHGLLPSKRHDAVTMKLLTYDDAAKLLSLPKGTLYWWVQHKRIPHVRLGPRTVRFERSALEEWIRTSRQDPR